MQKTSSRRTRIAVAGLALITFLGALFALPTGSATAAPGGAVDDEGGSAALRSRLAAASRGYTAAQAKVRASQRRQQELNRRITATEKRIAALTETVQEFGAAAYRGVAPSRAAAMASPGSLFAMVDRIALVDTLSARHEESLKELRLSRAELTSQRRKVQQQLVLQQREERTMSQRRRDAERALAEVGGERTEGFTGSAERSPSRASKPATSKPAKPSAPAPARRASDGSWPSEGCSSDDPTTSGCLTPRTRHALQQTKAAGFTRYVACFRNASFGEHPKGRACDFSATPTGFVNAAATGGNKSYGDRLAAWYVDNADRLAVLYVIWYRQIWLPGTGWRAYNSGGDPASAHTNHVHLSVQ